MATVKSVQKSVSWTVDDDEYKNSNKKDVAYEKLVEKIKEIGPVADRNYGAHQN